MDDIHEMTRENRLIVVHSLSWCHDAFVLDVTAISQLFYDNGTFPSIDALKMKTLS